MSHLNNQHPRIKFTTEKEDNGKIAFLDTEVQRKEDGSIKIAIYRKPTHTDQYLDWRSNHHISQKSGIFKTFQHRIETLITEDIDKDKETRHAKKALKRCGHPNWTLNRKQKPEKQEKMETVKKISIPYVKGTSEKISRTLRKYKIGTIHKPTTTIKNALCSKLKDKVHPLDKSNAIYRFDCKKCDKTYIGETERSLRYRAYDHKILSRKDSRRAHSLSKSEQKETQSNTQPMRQASKRPQRSANKQTDYAAMHSGSNYMWTEQPENATEIASHIFKDHTEEDYTFKLIATEPGWRKRTLKEALLIQREPKNKLLNENLGKHTYSPIYRLQPELTPPDAKESTLILVTNTPSPTPVNSNQGRGMDQSEELNISTRMQRATQLIRSEEGAQ